MSQYQFVEPAVNGLLKGRPIGKEAVYDKAIRNSLGGMRIVAEGEITYDEFSRSHTQCHLHEGKLTISDIFAYKSGIDAVRDLQIRGFGEFADAIAVRYAEETGSKWSEFTDVDVDTPKFPRMLGD